MQDLNPILLITGFAIGTVSIFLPAKLWLKGDVEKVDTITFKEQFPQKKWLPFLFQFLPLAWLAFYAFLLFPYYFSWFGLGHKQVYLLAYLFLAGIGLGDGVLEIITKVSPVRSFVGRSLQLRCLMYGHSIQRLGVLHIGFIVSAGAMSWLVLDLIFS